jgi:hypothetical protein
MARKAYKQDTNGLRIQGGLQETMIQVRLKAKE